MVSDGQSFVRNGIGAAGPHGDMQHAGSLGDQAFMDRVWIISAASRIARR